METEENTTPVALCPIATPLAGRKLTKKLFKALKKGAKTKSLRRGTKEVVKAIKKQKGFVVLAGDITPIDVISHLPVYCEENKIPYVFVPSKDELGSASATKRPTSCIFVAANDQDAEYKAAYDECFAEVKAAAQPAN
eukprot:TRINITY_DN1423_c0_g1_i1.p1 TRINITY_DN1423_c0_g1~~TRINITY_DN1423_c0_g1_i1.p1  ORF type:complete len:138 (-),score=35.53 TRINITY_DN1423_c0_g1_i1:241-654(-)